MAHLSDKIRDPKCKRCELHKTAHTICLIGDGPFPCEWVFVGDNPSDRDEINKPFSGRAGRQVLDVTLEQLDIDREDVYLTNIVHCSTPKGTKLSNTHIKECSSIFWKEMKYVRPKKMVVMGAAAVKGVMGKYNLSLKSVVGKKETFEFDWGKCEVLFTYHPAFGLDKPYVKKYFKEHLQQFLKEKERIPTIVLPYSFDKMIGVTKTSLDIEYKEEEEIITSIAVSPKKGYGYWVAEEDFGEVVHNASRGLIIGHNLKYDISRLIKHGLLHHDFLYDEKMFDTLLGINIIDENIPDKTLKYLSYTYTTMEHYERPEEDEWDDMNIVRPYNSKDADAGVRLYNYERNMFKKDPALLTPFKVDMRTLAVIIDLEMRGMKIDEEELSSMSKALKKKLKKIDSLIPVENPNSKKQIGEYLVSKGINLPPTKTQYKTDKATLEAVFSVERNERKREVLQAVIDKGKYDKLYSTFCKGIDSDSIDGIFYPTYFIAKREDKGEEGGTVTGRLSAKRFQQIPRDKETLEPEFNPRRLFIPRNPNKGWIISADFSQVEMAVAGIMYGEPLLVEMYDSGGDIHTLVASEVNNVKPKNVTKDQRKAAKTVNFGIVYGISEHGLASRLGWSKMHALSYIHKYFKRFPGLKNGLENQKDFVIEYGYAETYFHRRRRLPGAKRNDKIGEELLRQGINSPIQGTAADITKICMWELFKRYRSIKKTYVDGNVHDEILTETIDKYLDEVCEWIMEVYKRPPFEDYGLKPLPIALRGELKIGKNWFKPEKKIEF